MAGTGFLANLESTSANPGEEITIGVDGSATTGYHDCDTIYASDQDSGGSWGGLDSQGISSGDMVDPNCPTYVQFGYTVPDFGLIGGTVTFAFTDAESVGIDWDVNGNALTVNPEGTITITSDYNIIDMGGTVTITIDASGTVSALTLSSFSVFLTGAGTWGASDIDNTTVTVDDTNGYVTTITYQPAGYGTIGISADDSNNSTGSTSITAYAVVNVSTPAGAVQSGQTKVITFTFASPSGSSVDEQVSASDDLGGSFDPSSVEIGDSAGTGQITLTAPVVLVQSSDHITFNSSGLIRFSPTSLTVTVDPIPTGNKGGFLMMQP